MHTKFVKLVVSFLMEWKFLLKYTRYTSASCEITNTPTDSIVIRLVPVNEILMRDRDFLLSGGEKV